MSSNKVMDVLNKITRNDCMKDYTMIDRVEDHVNNLIRDNKENVVLRDGYGNSVTSSGTDDKISHYDKYSFDNDTLNFWLWLTLYNDSWVFKRAIDKPSQDQVRCGITLNLSNEQSSKIYDELNILEFDLIQLLQWGALFGGSVAVMMFDNLADEEYKNPLNKQKVRESKILKLYVTDRWFGVSQYGTENVDNMLDIDFGKPKYYQITFANGKSLVVHHDYIIRYEHRVAPKLIKTGQLQGWGYAEGAHIINELARDDKLKSSIQSLINKSLIEVIQMDGMKGVFMGADKENEEQLTKRLEMVNWARNYNSLTFLDTNDQYTMNTFSGLTGLSDILQENMWLISAALEMQGVLYGDLKNGWSTDVQALERYDETIQNRNKSYYKPCLQKLLNVLYIKYNIKEKVSFEFKSLLSKNQEKDKMESIQHYAQTLSQLLNDGIITPKLYAKSLQLYTNKGVVDLGLTDEEVDKLDERIEEEMEDIDLEETTNVSSIKQFK